MLRVDLSRHEKANKDRIQSHPDFVEAVAAILQEPKGGNSNIYWGLDTADTVYRGQRTFWTVNTLRQLDSSSGGTQVRSFAAVTAGQGTPAAPATAPQQQQQQQQQQELLQQQEQQRQALLLQQEKQRQELLRQQLQQQQQQATLTPAALTADPSAVTPPAGGIITAPTPHPALTPAGRATAERAVAAGMATAAGTAAVGGAAAGTSSGVPIAAA
jgi:hypothetical protein